MTNMAEENTKLTGTLLISAISPYNSTDKYPTHYAKYGHGGYRTVSNKDELEAIPEERREEGMLVYVATEDKIYKYKNGVFSILELGSGNGDDTLTEAKAYTDELANGAVKTNTEAIATLNGTGEGSVDKKVADAIAEIVANAPEDLNILKEIADYIESDKTGAAELSNTVAELEGKAHTHDNKEVLDGITAEKVSAWDEAEQNAKDYADSLAGNYDAAEAAEAAEAAAKAYADGLAVNYDAAGSAEAAEAAAKAYADGLAGNYDAAGAAATAEQNAKDYADSLADNYDAEGSAATAEQNAKDYADSLAGNYDAEGSAEAAEAAAKAYADGLAGNYDASGAAATAEQNAKAYADSLAGNYDAAGTAASEAASAAATAEQNAKDYSDELIKKYPVLEVFNDDENIDIYNQNNCINFYTNPEKKTLVSHPMRYINGDKEQGFERNNVAEGNYSTVIGYGCQILGEGDDGASNSFCGGDECLIDRHKDCFVYGKGLKTSGSHQTIFGKFNTPLDWTENGTKPNDIALIVGWGENVNDRKNLLVLQNGNSNTSNQSGDGGLMTYGPLKPGANYINDFSEYFEWFDGNPNNEDRVGYMVQLNGEKIELADSFERCIGIISVTSAFIGNSCSLEWHGKYLKDDFGRIICEEIDGKQVLKINPNYNVSLEYIPRDRRKEWGNVGILGQILVRQDGTLEAGDYAGCLNGIATKSTDNKGYRVLKIVSDKVALVLVK